MDGRMDGWAQTDITMHYRDETPVESYVLLVIKDEETRWALIMVLCD
jgi:hypothetical protein